jgi:hypothetical protein
MKVTLFMDFCGHYYSEEIELSDWDSAYCQGMTKGALQEYVTDHYLIDWVFGLTNPRVIVEKGDVL